MNIQQIRSHLTALESDIAADALSQDSLNAHSISLYLLVHNLIGTKCSNYQFPTRLPDSSLALKPTQTNPTEPVS